MPARHAAHDPSSEQAVDAQRVPHAKVAIRRTGRQAEAKVEIELLAGSDVPAAADIDDVARPIACREVPDVLDEEIPFRPYLPLDEHRRLESRNGLVVIDQPGDRELPVDRPVVRNRERPWKLNIWRVQMIAAE